MSCSLHSEANICMTFLPVVSSPMLGSASWSRSIENWSIYDWKSSKLLAQDFTYLVKGFFKCYTLMHSMPLPKRVIGNSKRRGRRLKPIQMKKGIYFLWKNTLKFYHKTNPVVDRKKRTKYCNNLKKPRLAFYTPNVVDYLQDPL